MAPSDNVGELVERPSAAFSARKFPCARRLEGLNFAASRSRNFSAPRQGVASLAGAPHFLRMAHAACEPGRRTRR
jgi:hypothetical protein